MPEQIQQMIQNPATASPDDGNGGTKSQTAPDISTAQPDAVKNPGTFASRLAAAMNQNAAAQISAGTHDDPGAWSRAIVGAVPAAISPGRTNTPQQKQQPLGVRVVNGIAARLGDAAGGMEVNGGHGGALSGVVGTLRAGAQRLTQQKQQDFENEITLAHSNAQLHKEQLLIHQLGDEATDKSIATGKTAIQTFLDAPQPGQLLYGGLDSDALHTLLINGKINPVQETVFPDGKVQTGVDQNGIPTYRATYAVMSLPKEVTVNEEQARDLSDSGQEVKAGQVLSGIQFNALSQQASNVRASQAAKKKFLEDNEMAATTQAKNLEASRLDQNPLWLNALAHNGGDPIKAMEAIQDNPEILKKLPYIRNDVRMWLGGTKENPGANFDAVIKDRQKETEKQTDYLNKLEDDPAQMSGEKAASAVVMLQSRLADPTTPNDLKPRIQRLVDQAKKAQSANETFEESKERAKQAITDGDPSAAAQLLVSRTVAPSQLVSTRKPQFATDAYKLAKKLDPNFDAGIYEAQYKVANSPQQSVFFGSANSLLDKGGTLDQLAANHAKLKNGQFPIFNKYEDLLNYQGGDAALAGFRQTVLGAADDYAKVMGGGTGSDSARNELVQSFSNALNKGQMAAALQSARDAVTSQRDARLNRNPYLKQMYGDPTQPQQQVQPQQPQRQAQQPLSLQQAQRLGATHKVPGPDGKMHWTNEAGTKDYGVAQ